MGETFNELVCYVTAFKVREDKYISLAGDLASGSFFLAYCFNQRSISLKFSLEHEFGCHLLCHPGGTYDLIHHLMSGAPHR